MNSALAGGTSLTERSVSLAVQSYVDQELIPYHQSLTKRLPTYASHIRVGLELLRGYLVPEIRKKIHRETVSEYQSAFFTLQRDMSPNLKLALDILSYSGMVSQLGTVKIAGGALSGKPRIDGHREGVRHTQAFERNIAAEFNRLP